ncbi:epoxyqueuosine reductase QueH [Ruminococcaceae bacterium OttesenSCG-928-A16]|nr:epoxyqueuosine reductase QueH [Ruminococcaceae bacterium OttesenSCG-928-A16]
MPKQNYQKIMEETMAQVPKGTGLLLHSCCGPCSTAVLEQLANHFKVTLLYYNPNIWPAREYQRRRDEQLEVLQNLPVQYPVTFEELPYNPDEFLQVAKGLQRAPEGGARCAECFKLRLGQGALFAKQRGLPWFTTTLTVSPHKNAPLLNQIGQAAAQKAGVNFLPADFKKKDGYKRSLELSAEYGLYRQEYCGCEYSYTARNLPQ